MTRTTTATATSRARDEPSRHPELGALILEHFGTVQEAWRGVVERGIARGEVDPTCAPVAVVDMLASQLVLAPLMLYRPPEEAEIEALVHLVLRATRPARDE
ncbi:TetR-like C-terminal domain-containing protein [Yinghuangia soli]|uniref:TetR/AcrR family transcriptional regulator C-terminal ligand-binding domain-containing protein n=1 Tax=Yinghuangia soli TaxID=2908204 RepID=A0AA41U1J3_9ACTN|nr:TetR-like C-terminal domain-containing protein [Yinghuangia soli]MCF2529696.1 TetR/AcrR family transcriptional regulator C-terminal ligand-binding domain-containing protein [Yinghuangia soli]